MISLRTLLGLFLLGWGGCLFGAGCGRTDLTGASRDGGAAPDSAVPRRDAGPSPGEDARPPRDAGTATDRSPPQDSRPQVDLPQPVTGGFGSICDPKLKGGCKASLTCMVVKWGSPSVGFCTKACSAGGELCNGGPQHTLPFCVLLDKEQHKHCGFVCDYKGQIGPCPAGTTCLYIAGMGLCVP
jgi:hypothetical protein